MAKTVPAQPATSPNSATCSLRLSIRNTKVAIPATMQRSKMLRGSGMVFLRFLDMTIFLPVIVTHGCNNPVSPLVCPFIVQGYNSPDGRWYPANQSDL
jgi:hypothetical protein